MNRLCPCCSHLEYELCCKPFHDGIANPPTALALMRSRYCAYALDLSHYIQTTTHPNSPYFEVDLKNWAAEIHHFSTATKFLRLEIYSSGTDWVHFCAHLEQNGKKVDLVEKSHFAMVNGAWKYHSSIDSQS